MRLEESPSHTARKQQRRDSSLDSTRIGEVVLRAAEAWYLKVLCDLGQVTAPLWASGGKLVIRKTTMDGKVEADRVMRRRASSRSQTTSLLHPESRPSLQVIYTDSFGCPCPTLQPNNGLCNHLCLSPLALFPILSLPPSTVPGIQ